MVWFEPGWKNIVWVRMGTIPVTDFWSGSWRVSCGCWNEWDTVVGQEILNTGHRIVVHIVTGIDMMWDKRSRQVKGPIPVTGLWYESWLVLDCGWGTIPVKKVSGQGCEIFHPYWSNIYDSILTRTRSCLLFSPIFT